MRKEELVSVKRQWGARRAGRPQRTDAVRWWPGHLCVRDRAREDWLEQTLQGPPSTPPPYPTPRDSASCPPFQPKWDLTVNAFSDKEWEFSQNSQNSQTETLHMAFLIFTKPYPGEEWRPGLLGSSATFSKPCLLCLPNKVKRQGYMCPPSAAWRFNPLDSQRPHNDLFSAP